MCTDAEIDPTSHPCIRVTRGTDALTRCPTSPSKFDDVTKIYGTRTVLDAIRLDVFQGETLVILGGSGSGKSTLLRLMIGNVTPDGGDIIGLGKSLCADDRRASWTTTASRSACCSRAARCSTR